jgi:Cyclic nucleotide-binding domain
MDPGIAELATNLTLASSEGVWATKLSDQLGLDPGNITFEAILDRLVDFAQAHVNLVSVLALAGLGFHVATLLMRTMVPLRVAGIVSDVCFIGYGVLANSLMTFLLYSLLLPINGIRLYQMLKLVKKARASADGDLSMDWLKPFTLRRRFRKGDILFRKGERANEMFFTVSGRFLVTEIAVELPPGRLVGELGFLSPDNRRTMTVECLEDGEVLSITYDKLLELWFQNPQFGYYFLRLSSERLLQQISRLERLVAQKGDAPAQAVGAHDSIPTVARDDDKREVASGFATWA